MQSNIHLIFALDQTSQEGNKRTQKEREAIRAYCPNIYTVPGSSLPNEAFSCSRPEM